MITPDEKKLLNTILNTLKALSNEVENTDVYKDIISKDHVAKKIDNSNELELVTIISKMSLLYNRIIETSNRIYNICDKLAKSDVNISADLNVIALLIKPPKNPPTVTTKMFCHIKPDAIGWAYALKDLIFNLNYCIDLTEICIEIDSHGSETGVF